MDWQEEGREPDYRFSLANERTFLSWMRIPLALLAAAVLRDRGDHGLAFLIRT